MPLCTQALYPIPSCPLMYILPSLCIIDFSLSTDHAHLDTNILFFPIFKDCLVFFNYTSFPLVQSSLREVDLISYLQFLFPHSLLDPLQFGAVHAIPSLQQFLSSHWGLMHCWFQWSVLWLHFRTHQEHFQSWSLPLPSRTTHISGFSFPCGCFSSVSFADSLISKCWGALDSDYTSLFFTVYTYFWCPSCSPRELATAASPGSAGNAPP